MGCWVFEGDGFGKRSAAAAGGALGVRTSESEELEPEIVLFFRLSPSLKPEKLLCVRLD
jgi:hypothetical protein